MVTAHNHPKLKDILCVLNFKYKSQVLSIPITMNSSFQDVMSRLCARWNSMSSAGISCIYSIGPFESVCLNVDDDFLCMLYHINEYMPKSVNITVMSGDLEDVVSVQQGSQQSQASNDPSVGFEEIMCPQYDVNHIEVDNPKFTDPWLFTIKAIGQRFMGGRKEFREELVKFSSVSGFNFCFLKNNSRSVSVYCANRDVDGCKWKISGTEKIVDGVAGVFVINSGNLVHDCNASFKKASVRKLKPKMMSLLIVDSVKSNPTFGGMDVKKLLVNQGGLHMSYTKAWRILQHARERLYGAYNKSFTELQWYGEAAKMTNPGTVTDLGFDDVTKCFTRFFISFKASLDGFKSCRPMLFIDATSLRGRFKGQLLTAIAKDGDNGLFPVAFAVVDAETTDHWTYFIRMIRQHVIHDQQIMFLSDRHPGIMAAFPLVYDEPVHFYCLFHLYMNLKGRYSGGWSHAFRRKMVSLLKLAAHAPTKTLYREHIQAFNTVGGAQAAAFLDNLPPDKWAIAYAPQVVRFGEMTSNAAESFNNVIGRIRSLPLQVMMDTIRQIIMSWYANRRSESARWSGSLCPTKEHTWNTYKHTGCSWDILETKNPSVWEVLSTVSQSVNLFHRSCTCYGWQTLGFPCVHAVRVISEKCDDISTIIDPCFFVQSYRNAYSHELHPIPQSLRGEAERNLVDIQPIMCPPVKPTAGRPKRKRIPSFGEVPHKKKKPFKCPHCHNSGRHDITTCGAQIVRDITELQHDYIHSSTYQSDSDGWLSE